MFTPIRGRSSVEQTPGFLDPHNPSRHLAAQLALLVSDGAAAACESCFLSSESGVALATLLILPHTIGSSKPYQQLLHVTITTTATFAHKTCATCYNCLLPAPGCMQIAAWRGGEGDDALDPGEAFERLELARKAAQAGDPSSTAFFAAASRSGRAAVRSPGSTGRS
jgi:hypothetical protein